MKNDHPALSRRMMLAGIAAAPVAATLPVQPARAATTGPTPFMEVLSRYRQAAARAREAAEVCAENSRRFATYDDRLAAAQSADKATFEKIWNEEHC